MQDRPGDPQSYFHLGNDYRRRGMIDEALACYEKSLAINPRSPQTLNNMGNALCEKGDFNGARRCYEDALKIDPRYMNAYNSLGSAFLDMAQFNEAIKIYKTLLEICPDYADAHNNLGIALRETGRFNEAIDSFRKALQFNPDLEVAHQNLSALLLLLGNFREGWKEYRWFWTLRGPYHELQRPLWDGSDIAGKTLLLHTGGGFGDTIQFVRYIPLVKGKSASIIVGCQKGIGTLLKGVEGVDSVLTQGEMLPDFDVQSSMFRLPIIFDTTIETIPARVPYITVDSCLIKKWRERVLGAGGDGSDYRIGLTWAGSHSIGTYRHRLFPPDLFCELTKIRGVRFYSLQKHGVTKGLLSIKEKLNLIDFTEDIRDFSDTAALIVNLDLVISIDTSVAHLAGALGKPVWTLLPWVPDWRWMLDREDSPWYPTMRLFRQPSFRDWDSVIGRVRAELEKQIVGKNSSE
jgi:hypothetical protein